MSRNFFSTLVISRHVVYRRCNISCCGYIFPNFILRTILTDYFSKFVDEDIFCDLHAVYRFLQLHSDVCNTFIKTVVCIRVNIGADLYCMFMKFIYSTFSGKLLEPEECVIHINI